MLVGNKASVSRPYHCPLCSGMCVRQWRWYLVGCWHPPGCPVLLHPCRQTFTCRGITDAVKERFSHDIWLFTTEVPFSTTVVHTKITYHDLDMNKWQWIISTPKSLNMKDYVIKFLMKKRRGLSAHRRPLCLAVVVLGMWMGSFRAPRRWTVRSWITSRMCLIQSCLFSRLEAWGRTRQRVRRETSTPELPTQKKMLNPTWVLWFATLSSKHASVNGLFTDCEMTTNCERAKNGCLLSACPCASLSPWDNTLQHSAFVLTMLVCTFTSFFT